MTASLTDRPKILFAHATYGLKEEFDRRGTGLEATQVPDLAGLEAALPGADVLVVSMLWQNRLLGQAPRLRYLQSVSSGMNQYDAPAFAARGIALCSGQGVNRNAVSEQAMGLMLALTRQLGAARDHQRAGHWRPAIVAAAAREDELAGKTLLVVGLGAIGARVARLARAFDMQVIGIRRDPARGGEGIEVQGFAALPALLPRADVVVLCCPLTEETRNLLDARALALLPRHALVINVARGGCIDEPALIAALAEGRIAGAGLDVTAEEPLAEASPLWRMPNVLLTPHSAGETRFYERNVVDILLENLGRLGRGEAALVNRIA